MKKNKHIIKMVQPGSIAEELEIEPGDELISINGQKIEDVFDYHYLVNDDYLTVLIRKTNGEEWELEIEKDYEEDLGIEFDNGLMDEYRSCRNNCIFCFIDQMPPGMRETLYFKDDDSRLSFLFGNYITPTNLSEHEAAARIHRMDKMRKENYHYYTKQVWGMADNYDICIDSSVGEEKMTACIMQFMKDLA